MAKATCAGQFWEAVTGPPAKFPTNAVGIGAIALPMRASVARAMPVQESTATVVTARFLKALHVAIQQMIRPVKMSQPSKREASFKAYHVSGRQNEVYGFDVAGYSCLLGSEAP